MSVKTPFQFPDFDNLVVNDQEVLTWTFQLAQGVTLTGTPVVTVTQAANGSDQGATDPSPQGCVIGSPSIGADSLSISVTFKGQVGGVRYLLVVSCARSNGLPAEGFNHIFCVLPK